MNSLTTRCAALALCATTLAACGGGGSGSIPLSGAITGLNRDGLVLENKGQESKVTSPYTGFLFTTLVASDAEFEILVKTNPPGVICTPSSNKGRANYYSYQQTRITCNIIPYTLGGKVNGLTKEGLVLADGSLTVTVPAGASSFSFGKIVPNGLPYGVTVLAQPAGQTCTVQNATGTMPTPTSNDQAEDTLNVNNVVVNCQ